MLSITTCTLAPSGLMLRLRLELAAPVLAARDMRVHPFCPCSRACRRSVAVGVLPVDDAGRMQLPRATPQRRRCMGGLCASAALLHGGAQAHG